MLEIFSGGRESKEGVVVLLSPSENRDLFEKVGQKMEEAGAVPM